jgi:hypothetical protein
LAAADRVVLNTFRGSKFGNFWKRRGSGTRENWWPQLRKEFYDAFKRKTWK